MYNIFRPNPQMRVDSFWLVDSLLMKSLENIPTSFFFPGVLWIEIRKITVRMEMGKEEMCLRGLGWYKRVLTPTLSGKKHKRNRLGESWLRPSRPVTDIRITSNYHHTSALRCCCLRSKMSQWILKGALCSLKGKKPNVLSFFRTHSGKWALWIGTLQSSPWGQRRKRENRWKLLIRSQTFFLFWSGGVCVIVVVVVFLLLLLYLSFNRNWPDRSWMRTNGEVWCVHQNEGLERVIVYIDWEAFQVVGLCYPPTCSPYFTNKWYLLLT